MPSPLSSPAQPTELQDPAAPYLGRLRPMRRPGMPCHPSHQSEPHLLRSLLDRPDLLRERHGQVIHVAGFLILALIRHGVPPLRGSVLWQEMRT